MGSFLRDPWWDFWGVMISVVALVVSTLVAWRQTRRKRLVYFTKSLTVVSVSHAVRERIQILYDNRPVSDVSLHEFGVRNAGDLPVDDVDFVQPITFTFGPEATVLRVELLRSKPHGLDVALKINEGGGSFSIPPILLNPRDQIIGTALTAGGAVPRVTARIKGIPELEEQQQITVNLKRLIGTLVVGAVILSYVTITLGDLLKWHFAYTFLLYLGLVGLIFGRQLRNMWRRWPD